MHTRRVILLVGVSVILLFAGVLAWRLLSAPSTYEQAVGSLPESTLRTTYTHWETVREKAGGSSLGAGSSGSRVKAFLGRAYDQDLTSGSGLTESTGALERLYGVSPLDAEWEALGQSTQGQVDVLRVDDDVDLPGVERTLRRLGYDAPSTGSGKGGTWVGTPELVARLGSSLTPLQQNVVVLPEQRLVLMSDVAAYATEAAQVARGTGDSLRSQAGVDALAHAAGDPTTAVQWTSTFACQDLTMGSADETDQATGKDLVARAGKISPLEGLVMAQQPDRRLRVGMHFETSDQASSNLQTRVDLASGDAPGQGGSFADRFSVTSGESDGQDVLLTLTPKSSLAVLSDISTGPVLFATC